MRSIYFEYSINDNLTSEMVDKTMLDLLENNGIESAHTGFLIDDKIYDVRYDCSNDNDADIVETSIKQIPNLIKFEIIVN